MEKKEIRKLELFAAKARFLTLDAIGNLGEGHIGGAFSIMDLLTVLYEKELKYNSSYPKWEDRDRLIISKGHSGPALYSILAMEGFFPIEDLRTLNTPDTYLPSHCDSFRTPGIDVTTGSLGQGLSCAVGIAMANKLDGRNNYVYTILGDGECQEGQVWEAAMYCSHKNLNNMIVFVDNNQYQVDGRIEEICDLKDIEAKFGAFGFYTLRIDGHDMEAISSAILKAKQHKEGPSVIIMDTIKGKDCSFCQGAKSHYMRLTKNQVKEGLDFLAKKIAILQEELNLLEGREKDEKI